LSIVLYHAFKEYQVKKFSLTAISIDKAGDFRPSANHPVRGYGGAQPKGPEASLAGGYSGAGL